MYPANSHVIRIALPQDAHALHRLARTAGQAPLTGRIVVAEVRGEIAAAVSRDERRTLVDRSVAPAHLTTLLRMRVTGMEAAERQPDLAERLREAVLGPRREERVPLAA
jgi:hypothetical protein